MSIVRNGDSNQTLHQSLLMKLRQVISKLKAGSPLPPERVMAEDFGVSRMTVNKVLTQLTREGVIERVRGRGTFVAEHKASMLRTASEGKRILLAYPDCFSYSLYRLLHSMGHEANMNGLAVDHILVDGNGWVDQITSCCADDTQVEGVIFIPPGSDLEDNDLQVLDALNLPVVGIFYSEFAQLYSNFYSVSNSDYYTGHCAAKFLLDNGYIRLAYIPNEPWSHGCDTILAGMRQACCSKGGEASVVLPRSRNIPGGDSRLAGGQMVREILDADSAAEGFVFQSFSGALEGMRVLSERKIKIPEQAGVASLSGHSCYEESLNPSLTTIESNPASLAKMALEPIVSQNRETIEKIRRVNVEVHPRESVRGLK